MSDKPVIREVIVVEGRDDTASIKRAVEAQTIETHGFGISRSTWEEIERVYLDPGIIILTDPDHAGETIRKRVKDRFPGAGEAFIAREKASKKGDVGIENAEPEDIVSALEKARVSVKEDVGKGHSFTMKDIRSAGLTGQSDSRQRRQVLCDKLGIGYGNAHGLLRKLNGFRISKEEFHEAIREIDNQEY